MTETNLQRARIFISYKRNVEPDEPVALGVLEVLRQHHGVFIDQTMLVGTRWAERIEAELRQANFLITFLAVIGLMASLLVALVLLVIFARTQQQLVES
jgi:TIR domain